MERRGIVKFYAGHRNKINFPTIMFQKLDDSEKDICREIINFYG